MAQVGVVDDGGLAPAQLQTTDFPVETHVGVLAGDSEEHHAVAVVVAEDGVDGSSVAFGQGRERERRAEVAAEHQGFCAAVPDGRQRLGELIQVIVRVG